MQSKLVIYDYSEDLTDEEIAERNPLEVRLELPAKYHVCPRCRGKGTHVNPAIDEHGLTAEDFHEQGSEFVEDYFSGVYDVVCYECKGRTTILSPDFDRLSDEEAHYYEQFQMEEAANRAEYEAERRMGC